MHSTMESSLSRSSTEDQKSAESSGRAGEDRVAPKQEDEIECAKAEIGEAKEENKRLKRRLDHMENDYRFLQVQFFDILKRSESPVRALMSCSASLKDGKLEPEPVCLSLGMSPAEPKQDNKKEMVRRSDEEVKPGLSLGLDTKLQIFPEVMSTPTSQHRTSLEEHRDEDVRETWSPSKVQKTVGDGEVDDLSRQAQVKRARVCVRARCDSTTMNDGCQWRKYGQKISKGNPCPRAYYRCTVAPACPVRKQVQRCVEDMSILITTYEGTHNHALPASATAMASTTSAAASMLLSGSSSTSQTGLGFTPTSLAGPNGLNLGLYHSSMRSNYYTNSPSTLHPTITLDLTTSSPSLPMAHLGHLDRLYSRPGFQGSNLGYSNNLPTGFAPNGSFNQAREPPQALTDTLTKVLTTDPAFQSVIAAAVQSMVQNNNRTQLVGQPSFPALRYPVLDRDNTRS